MIRRYPIYKQYDERDCGPACLKMIARYYGKHYSLNYLREKSYQQRLGTNFLGLSEAAKSIGFTTCCVKVTWDKLQHLSLPCIVQWNKNHFVVLYKIGKKKVVIGDPCIGILRYKIPAFLHCWRSLQEKNEQKGVALLFMPTPDFYTYKEEINKSLTFSSLKKYIRPFFRHFAGITTGLLVGSGLSLLFPLLTQSVVDKGIGNKDIGFVWLVLIGQVVLTLGIAVNSLIRDRLMLHVGIRIGISFISDFLLKVMRLPISFFDTKQVGDINQRISDFNRIRAFITSALVSIIVSIVILSIYGTLMGAYSLKILSVFFAGSVFYLLWICFFLQKKRKIDYMRFEESINNQDNIVQLIEGMQEIKLNNCEERIRKDCLQVQQNMYNIEQKGLALSQTQEIGGVLIDQCKNVFITFMAASAVIEGYMTLGMMMALQYIIGQLNAPLANLIALLNNYQEARLSMERMNEIYTRKEEECDEEEYIQKIPANADLILQNVTFQYAGPKSLKVLKNINFTISANKVTAIVGASGSGKTTLLKLLLGYYKPIEGQITLGGIPLKNYSVTQWRKHCACVMQEGMIFSYDIAKNISIVSEEIDMNRVKEAARIANLSDFIEKLPLKYNTLVGKKGIGISTGQKQRLLIARAAYKDAEFIIFDEATNSLDATNERIIMDNLYEFFKGKTVIVVAHRLSTVKNADNIVVLNQGEIVEQGHHHELIAQHGYYFNLVKNQLELGD